MILGDKGDGSPRSRALAKQRYGWANEGYVSDIIEKHAADNGNHVCYESKVYASLKKNADNQGGGTQRSGGSASTVAGDRVAFGCCEEALLVKIYGCKARGRAGDRAFDHATGTGWVQARDGDYHDAIHVKGNTVVALIANPFGGVTRTVERLVRRLAKVPGMDGTKYGEHSLPSFFAHHAAAISMACVWGDSEMLVRGASDRETAMVRAR